MWREDVMTVVKAALLEWQGITDDVDWDGLVDAVIQRVAEVGLEVETQK